MESELLALLERLNDPINTERKKALSLNPNGHDLVFHLNRINTYIEYSNQTDPIEAQLIELDYTASLRIAKKLMDQQGWK